MHQFVPIVHAVAAVFAIIELGLTAYLVTPFDNRYYGGGAPSTIAFMLFCSIWSLLILLYLALSPLYYARIFHALVALALEWVTMIFWFAGSIALACYWGSPHCDGNTYCGSMEAAIAFGFFLWALFGFVVIVDTIATLRARGHHTGTTAAAGPKPYVGA